MYYDGRLYDGGGGSNVLEHGDSLLLGRLGVVEPDDGKLGKPSVHVPAAYLEYRACVRACGCDMALIGLLGLAGSGPRTCRASVSCRGMPCASLVVSPVTTPSKESKEGCLGHAARAC